MNETAKYSPPLREGSGGGSYYRYEIALRYFPESLPDVALRRLNYWICKNTQLKTALQDSGYRARGKTFTRAQIQLIYHFLGEP